MPGKPQRFVPEQSAVGQGRWDRRMAKFSRKTSYSSFVFSWALAVPHPLCSPVS